MLLLIENGAYAGGMDKQNIDYPYFAGGHRNQRNLPAEIYGYDIGDLTDNAYVVIDRNQNNTFGEYIMGAFYPDSGDELRWMHDGDIIFTNEDPYGQGTAVETINVIPEPCTLGLFVLGGMAVALKRTRRKTSR